MYNVHLYISHADHVPKAQESPPAKTEREDKGGDPHNWIYLIENVNGNDVGNLVNQLMLAMEETVVGSYMADW